MTAFKMLLHCRWGGGGGGGVTNGQGKLEIPAKMRELIQWSSGKNIKFRKFYQYILGVRE